MSDRGHNETAVRLAALAGDAQVALDKVEQGEAETINGWLAYGAALNEGRSLLPSDEQFGKWVREQQLDAHGSKDDRTAAMWAAANTDQFEEARASGKARTIRGIHAKWKEIEAERERKAKVDAEEKARKEAAEKAAQDGDQVPEAAAQPPTDNVGKSDATAPEAEPKAEEPQPNTPDPQPDPHAKLRAEFRKLTGEAKEEDWVNFRVEIDDLRKRVKAQRSEIADLKAQIRDLSDSESGQVIRKLNAKIENIGNG